jgi:hypothetical protein
MEEGATGISLIGILIFAYVVWSELKPKPASDYWSDDMCERHARKNGWVPDEYNGQRAGVRHQPSGKWAEDWRRACKIGENPGSAF